MIHAVTGHQPPALGGYGSGVADALVRLAMEWVREARPDEVVSGMAAGWDLAVAEAAVIEGVPLTAALAHASQGEGWPDEARAKLDHLVSRASTSYVLATGRTPGMWTRRDRWVLDRGDAVVALWSGVPGGTGRAVATATKLGKPVTNLWGRWLDLSPEPLVVGVGGDA